MASSSSGKVYKFFNPTSPESEHSDGCEGQHTPASGKSLTQTDALVITGDGRDNPGPIEPALISSERPRWTPLINSMA